MSYQCLVADDEPIARQIIEKYIMDTPDLNLASSCKNAFEVMDELEKQPIDIVFLDINMPKLTGIGLLKSLRSYPNVIITTAYAEYALEGFELDVVDYLLKPISFDRFLKAVRKVLVPQKEVEKDLPLNTIPPDTHLFVKSDKRMIRIAFEDIVYASAFGNYVKIYLGEMILSPSTLNEFLTKLPDDEFIRIHKSHIINHNHIKHVEGNQITLSNGKVLPIGKAYRKNVSNLL